MLKALDSNNELVYIDKAIQGKTYYCQICKQPLIQKRGEIKIHHFAHYSPHGRHANYIPCPDTWKYDMTDWHMDWQKQFDYKDIEKVITIGNSKHIADVLVGNIVVEFQHSPISIEDFRDRNDFYTKAGHKVIWVFDLIEDIDNQKIRYGEYKDNEYCWTYVKKVFKDIDIENEKATIYIQTSGDNAEKVLERVTKSYNSFQIFYTDYRNSLSKSDFVSYVKSNNINLFPKPKAPDRINGGKTIAELWKKNYKWMIVNNLFDKTTILIQGKDGAMFTRKKYDREDIVGRYSNYDNKLRKYVYSDEYYEVKDAEKEIWTLITYKIDEEYEIKEKKRIEEENRRKEEKEKYEIELKKRLEEQEKQRLEEQHRKELANLEMQKKLERLRELRKYSSSFPDYMENGIELTTIINNNFRSSRVIKNLYNNKCYYFTFSKGQAFYDIVEAINHYNMDTREIGDKITDEEFDLINSIANKMIWSKE